MTRIHTNKEAERLQRDSDTVPTHIVQMGVRQFTLRTLPSGLTLEVDEVLRYLQFAPG